MEFQFISAMVSASGRRPPHIKKAMASYNPADQLKKNVPHKTTHQSKEQAAEKQSSATLAVRDTASINADRISAAIHKTAKSTLYLKICAWITLIILVISSPFFLFIPLVLALIVIPLTFAFCGLVDDNRKQTALLRIVAEISAAKSK